MDYHTPALAGSDWLFTVLLATMMLPGVVTMIPIFIIFKEIGWVGTFFWVPSWFTASPFIFPHASIYDDFALRVG
ncbi:MAG: hypothetical protein R2932_25890 [Caldilineaceae bacterium]